MEIPEKLPHDLDESVNDLGTLLKARINFMSNNFYSEGAKLCTIEEEVRIITEIHILTAHYTAGLLLSAY